MTPNLIKDKSNQDFLDKKVFDTADNKLSTEVENKINEKLETSFQDFLKEYDAEIADIDNKLEKEFYDEKFNERLDKDVGRVLEQTKIENIKNINSDIESDLKSLEFEIQLTALQDEINNNENIDRKAITADDLSGLRVLSVSRKEVATEINKIKDNDRFEEISELLKSGKTEELQLKMVNLLDPKSEGILWTKEARNNQKSSGKVLGKYGVDDRFGTNTFAGLEQYVTEINKIEAISNTNNGTESNENPDGTSSGTESNNGSSSSNNSVAENYSNTNGVETGLDDEGNGVEVFDTGDVHVTLNEGEKEVLATGFDATDKLKFIPPSMVGDLKIEGGKLIYTGAKSGQETMRVVIKDKNDNVKYNHVITFDVKGKSVDGGVDVNGKGGEFDKFMKSIENKSLSNKLEAINDKVLENEKIILELNKKTSLTDAEKKQKKGIIMFTEQLLRKNELLNMKEQFNKEDKTELIKKLKANVNINIGGKHIDVEKFIKDLEKKPELVDDIHIVGLNIDLTKDYRNHLNANSSKLYNIKTKYEITSIVLSDDENYGDSNDLTNTEQIQYKADAYIDMEKRFENSEKISEKRALKRILGIKGLFGRGGVDEDMSIATQDYETNNPVFKERKNLRRLKKVLMRFVKDDDNSVKDAFEKVYEAYEKGPAVLGDDKNLNKLLDLYTIYRDNANGMIGGGDYFQKAMGLLDNYFIKGVKNVDMNDDGGLFNKLYHQENIGRMDGYIDPDKKKKAMKAIFKGKFDGPENVDLLGVSFENSKELKDLKKIVKHVDIGDHLINGVDMDDKWSRRFEELFLKYKNSPDNKVMDTGDGMTTREANYYNAVFDLLVGIGEGRQSMVEAVNSLKIANSTENVELENNDENYYSSKEEKQFVMMLADFNSDARSDHGDRGVRVGLEIKNVYKNVKIDQMNLYPSGSSVAWENLVEFTKLQMKKNGEEHLLSDLETNGLTLPDLIAECNKNPGLLNYMQNVLANSPMPVEDIFRYGDEAAENYLDSGDGELLARVLDGSIEIKGTEELLDKQIQNLVAQGLKVENIPELRTVLKPSFYGGLIQNGGNMIKSVGFGLALNTENAGTFSMNLGYTDVPGDNGGQAVGIVMAWGHSTELSDKTDLSYGVAAGSTIGSLFIPVASINTGIKTLINEDNLDENLRPKSAKYFHIGANATMIGALPTWGLYAGMSQDKIEGINKQYENIKNSLAGTDGILYKILTDPRFGTQNEIALIKNLLFENFPKSDANERDTAANNIARGLSYYNLIDNLDGSDPRVTAIVHDMAENYALQWKNAAMDDAEGNVYLESVGVGVQFLAGYYPIPVLYASVAWSKNTYSVETGKSYADYLSHLTTGNSMERIDDIDGFYNKNGITDKAVDYLNAKMSIAHPDIDVSRLDMQISVGNAQNTQGGVSQSLYIPQSLYRYVNINIDSGLANYTNICKGSEVVGNNNLDDDASYIEVPMNAKIALLNYSRTNAGRFNLIIGDTKAELDDVIVNGSMEDYDGNPADFEGINEIYMDQGEINTKLNDLSDVTLSTGSNSSEIIKQPLNTCDSVVGGYVIFDLLGGEEYVDMGGVNSVLNIVNGKLTMPQFGTLTMYYNADGKYEMYYSSSPSDKLDISFDVEGTSWTGRYESDSNLDMFEEYNILDRKFDYIEDELSVMDGRNNSAEYAAFMNAAAEAGIDDILDTVDVNTAFDKLKIILNGKLSDPMFDDLRDVVNGSPTWEQKTMIVDRFKAIFSYDIDLTNGENDGAHLKYLIGRRGDIYRNLDGYDKNANFPLPKGYRKAIVDELGDNKKLDKVEVDNLLGFTAFYRLKTDHGTNPEGRSYSMTQMGSTNVLNGKLVDIEKDDLIDTKERFWKNLTVSKVHKDLFKKSLNKKIEDMGVLGVDVTAFSDDQLKSMLSGESVDIGGKNVKLDLNYYFYLLGECGNESIGVKIDKIEVTEGGSDDGGDKISVDPKTAGKIYVDGVESRNENRHARKGSMGVGLAGGRAKEIIPPDPNDGTGEIPDPNQGTGSQDGTGNGG